MLEKLPKNWKTSDFFQKQKDEFDAKYLKKKSKIGQGSFGTVFLGSSKRDENKEVAIKVCTCSDNMTEKHSTKFIDHALKEVTIWCKVKASPFILDLIDCFVMKNGGKNSISLYIITPFMPCGDLEQYIVKKYVNAGLPFKTVCIVAIQLLLAVKHIHDHGFAHLDIKPDNIMVSLGPDNELVKLLLIDFGCAKNFVNSKTIHASKSAGSPFFEAPEVKQGKYGQCMQEVDIYSIGKTLLVAVLGYNPQNVEIKEPGEWIATWKVPPAPQNSELVQMANKLIAEKPDDRASLDNALNDYIEAFGHDSTVEIQDFDFAVKQLLERNDLGFVGQFLSESKKKLTKSNLRGALKPALLNETATLHGAPTFPPLHCHDLLLEDENSDPTTGAAKATKKGTGNGGKRPSATRRYPLRRNH